MLERSGFQRYRVQGSRMSSLTMMITLEKAVQNFELRVLAEAFLAVR